MNIENFVILSTQESEKMGDKFGNFDWIVNFDQLRPYVKLEEPNGSHPLPLRKALVIGCGTSTVSERLLDAGFDTVVSMDNDEGCITHMKTKCSNNPKLEWCVADIITGEGFACSPHLSEPQQYDVILDKGTLDAILVEGVVSEALVNVYNLLQVEGKYLVCSLSPSALLMPLLCAPVLQYEVTCFESCNYGGEKPYAKEDITKGVNISKGTGASASTAAPAPPCEDAAASHGVGDSVHDPLPPAVVPAAHDSMRGTIITCVKTRHSGAFQTENTCWMGESGVKAQLLHWENKVMDEYFQKENSLVTSELKASLFAKFYTDNRLNKEGLLPTRDAYLAMFGGEDNELGYSFVFFVGDFASYRSEKLEEQRSVKGTLDTGAVADGLIHHDEALDFIASVQ